MSVPCVKLIDSELIRRLGQSARSSPRLRSHFNLHDQLDDPCQRMIVAIDFESYVRPHRHLHSPKSETLLCLHGRIGVAIFDDDGQIVQSIPLAPSSEIAGCEIPVGVWHSIVGLQALSVFLEAKPGPYVQFTPEDFASWSPEDGSEAAARFLAQLRRTFT